MATIQSSSGQGALFELVARGVKDQYFVKDDPSSVFPYDASYDSAIHHLAERRTMVPINQTAFGKSFEVELDTYGDVMTECAFEIELPSWFPPLLHQGQRIDPTVVNRLYSIQTPEGKSYGYVNQVGYFLFDNIKVYQDQILLQEWSGDGLLVREYTEGSWTQGYLTQILGGSTTYAEDVSEQRAIELRATPGRLRVKLPLPGMQSAGDRGLPLCAISWQKFRIRATLRKLEDLVVCSDTTVIKPAPWSEASFSYTDDDTVTHTFSPKSLLEMGTPTIYLSTIQHYLPEEARILLKGAPIHIPYRRQYEHVFTISETDYVPLDMGSTATFSRRLDGRHPTERVFWFFRNSLSASNNRLDDFSNDYMEFNPPTATLPSTQTPGGFYYRMKLLIAGREREHSYEPFLWQDLNGLMKSQRSAYGISSMNWSLSNDYRNKYEWRQPEGTVNFSTADRPTLSMDLAPIRPNPEKGDQRIAEWRVFTEGWCAYEVKEGRGRMMFAS